MPQMTWHPRSHLGHAITVLAVVAVVALASACSPASPRAPLPQGQHEWLIFDVEVPDRDSRELLRSFEANARAFGCSTEKGGGWSAGLPGGGRHRIYSAILAQCDEGSIAMAAVTYTRVRLACPKPGTREQCEALLGQISPAR
jgi:hypothetical protein